MLFSRGLVAWCGALLVGAGLAGCGTSVNRAPVEDRSSVGAVAPAAADETKPLPGIENAGKPGYYTIRPGDTLIRIGLETGQSWKDLARWNELENADLIEVGQVIRVVPPVAATSAAVVAGDTGVVTRPVTQSSLEPAAADKTATDKAAIDKAGAPAAPNTTATATPAAPAAASTPAPVAGGPDEIRFSWPTQGSVLAGFDESRNKGLDISGKAGDPVLAAADGRVVYAGAGLRGYGNLIILKHNNTYLTAYAHNRALLVKEDQNVRRGQKIAEMGSTDADRVKLHFEIRRQGKPVDPARYLPAR